MTQSNKPSFGTLNVHNALFAIAALAILVSAIPVSALAGVQDLSGAIALSMVWLFMGAGTFLAMKKSGAFRAK